ncbi:MAG TPA: NUDIX hydrolase [Bacteroidota bacterium]|nr:NUDIX hydrolase [Bacteroidota bacterium]
MNFEVLRKEKLYNGRIVNLVVDHIRYASGNEAIREIIEHPGGSVILPVLDNDDIILVKQYRYPIEGEVIELPAGKLDAGEDPLHCAERELREETGYVAQRWTKLTAMLTTPGFCNERLHIYMAQGLSQSPQGQSLEEGEQTIQLLRLPIDEAVAMIERHEIVDGKSIAGIFMGEKLLRRGR